MQFVFQELDIELDFQNSLRHAREYWRWKSPDTTFDIKFYSEVALMCNPERWCPIGTVEFCEDWIEKVCKLDYCKPLNIPPSLLNISDHILHRQNISSGELTTFFYQEARSFNEEYFVKSADKIKDPRNGFYERNEKVAEVWKGTNVQISSRIDIKSEWRCFVFRNTLVGMKHYLGNMFIVPREAAVHKMIDYIRKSSEDYRPAYTLDVGLVKTKDNYFHVVPIEMHDFFACGLYGFDDMQNLPLMYWNWWIWHVAKASRHNITTL